MTDPVIPLITPYHMPRGADIPENTAQWTVDPQRCVLLVHDMQHYFLGFFPPGESPVSELFGNVSALRRSAADAGVPVTYTAQPGDMTAEQRGLLKDFWGEGMSATPEHKDIPRELAPTENDVVFDKWRPSAFFSTGLLELLRSRGRDQLVLCGVYAHVGLLQTACEAFAHDIETFVVSDAVADFSERDHRMALDYVATRCAMVVPTAAVTGALTGAAVVER